MKANLNATHFMVDLETLDTTPTAHILETAFVCFNPVTGEVYDEWSLHARHGLAHQEGSTINAPTIEWWFDTNKEYLAELFKPSEQVSLYDTLFRIVGLLQMARNAGKVCVWNTGSFDTDILNNAFRRMSGHSDLISFFEVRDVRAIRQISSMYSAISQDKSKGTHNAWEDCIRQIKWVTNLTSALEEHLPEGGENAE